MIVEARQWFDEGPHNAIAITSVTSEDGGEDFVEGLYELGAVKVEVVIDEEESTASVLHVTLPENKDQMIDVLLQLGRLTAEATSVRLIPNSNTLRIAI